MIGKLGGHAGNVMTILLLGAEEPYLMLTGSRDHYIKVGCVMVNCDGHRYDDG